MVSVTTKPSTTRTAVAAGFVRFAAPDTTRLVQEALIKKGDVLSVARVAGIMAAKKTSELIPLCHPIALGSVGVELEVVTPGQGYQPRSNSTTATKTSEAEGGALGSLEGGWGGEDDDAGEANPDNMSKACPTNFGGVRIEARVQCHGPTGVEMEAITAVMGAAATVYDMCKAVDRAMVVEEVRVVRKEGGRSGSWVEEGYIPLIKE